MQVEPWQPTPPVTLQICPDPVWSEDGLGSSQRQLECKMQGQELWGGERLVLTGTVKEAIRRWSEWGTSCRVGTYCIWYIHETPVFKLCRHRKTDTRLLANILRILWCHGPVCDSNKVRNTGKNINTDDPQIMVWLHPNKLIGNWKYGKLKMHSICLTFWSSQLSNTPHWSVLVVSLYDCVGVWELWLSATAQRHKTASYYISLAQEKIKIQMSKYYFYWTFAPS
jgi:hypothetical protein